MHLQHLSCVLLVFSFAYSSCHDWNFTLTFISVDLTAVTDLSVIILATLFSRCCCFAIQLIWSFPSTWTAHFDIKLATPCMLPVASSDSCHHFNVKMCCLSRRKWVCCHWVSRYLLNLIDIIVQCLQDSSVWCTISCLCPAKHLSCHIQNFDLLHASLLNCLLCAVIWRRQRLLVLLQRCLRLRFLSSVNSSIETGKHSTRIWRSLRTENINWRNLSGSWTSRCVSVSFKPLYQFIYDISFICCPCY